jgi:CheY-like chemotaxis protein
MTAKRALVVDDSRSARESLARLLSQYDLEVDFAESGEAALEFLKHRLVDVIFMDHTMPGMDGLEAVSAIKGNPRTATIPVMMYTAKEGEVYVGQARALGALGVLPKQVQPGVLWDMLRKLGLVEERRSDVAGEVEPPPRQRFAAPDDDVDRELDDRALGASVEARVSRIVAGEMTQLRADILAGQRRVAREAARDAAREVLAGHRPEGAEAPSTIEPPRAARRPAVAVSAAAAIAAALCVVLAAAFWHVREQRDAAVLEVGRLSATVASHALSPPLDPTAPAQESAARQREQAARLAAALTTVEWALNQGFRVPFDEPPFNDAVAAQVQGLVERLAAVDFRGTVTLTAHLGSFCLVRDGFGGLALAPADLPAADCEFIGHPLEDSVAAESLQSVTFAATLGYLADLYDRIAVSVRADDAGPTPRVPSGVERAGDWNRRAMADNRVAVAFSAAAGT